jgi:hypothetical protein
MGDPVGDPGLTVGLPVGLPVGEPVGLPVGLEVGLPVMGDPVGEPGLTVGLPVGLEVGLEVGSAVSAQGYLAVTCRLSTPAFRPVTSPLLLSTRNSRLMVPSSSKTAKGTVSATVNFLSTTVSSKPSWLPSDTTVRTSSMPETASSDTSWVPTPKRALVMAPTSMRFPFTTTTNLPPVAPSSQLSIWYRSNSMVTLSAFITSSESG